MKRVQLNKTLTIEKVGERELNDFVTERSLTFFDKLRLPRSLLGKDPSQWETDSEYQKASDVVVHIRVTNNLAERGVSLIKDFQEAALTKNEEQLQLLLRIVSRHRKQMPVVTKNAVIKAFDM